MTDPIWDELRRLNKEFRRLLNKPDSFASDKELSQSNLLYSSDSHLNKQEDGLKVNLTSFHPTTVTMMTQTDEKLTEPHFGFWYLYG